MLPSLMPLSAIEELIEREYRSFVTEVMPRVRKAFGDGVAVKTEPFAREDDADRPRSAQTVPYHRVVDEASIEVRHRALVKLLVDKQVITEDEYEAEIRELMKQRTDEP